MVSLLDCFSSPFLSKWKVSRPKGTILKTNFFRFVRFIKELTVEIGSIFSKLESLLFFKIQYSVNICFFLLEWGNIFMYRSPGFRNWSGPYYCWRVSEKKLEAKKVEIRRWTTPVNEFSSPVLPISRIVPLYWAYSGRPHRQWQYMGWEPWSWMEMRPSETYVYIS